mgnify:CR=1 FL=1
MKSNGPSIPESLELSEEDVRWVSLTFGVTLYTDALFSEVPEAMLRSFNLFLNTIPPDSLRFYSTETMRKHKPITKRTFGMLEAWSRPDAPARKDIDLELKDGNAYQDAPKFKFHVCAGEKGSTKYKHKLSNVVSMAFPAEWGMERADDLLKYVENLCSFFPFQSGHAGFSFEYSRYAAKEGQQHAWNESMRHRGIDISGVPKDTFAVGQDGAKGVGWLTILSEQYVEQIGGLANLQRSLSKDIELIDVPSGTIIKAGPMPLIGDVNEPDDLSLYREVYRVIEPLVETAAGRCKAWTLGGTPLEKTKTWYRRLSDA